MYTSAGPSTMKPATVEVRPQKLHVVTRPFGTDGALPLSSHVSLTDSPYFCADAFSLAMAFVASAAAAVFLNLGSVATWLYSDSASLGFWSRSTMPAVFTRASA